MWLPVTDPASKAAEDLVVVANEQYKLKVYNGNTAVLRRTALGPTFGGPICRCERLHTGGEERVSDVTGAGCRCCRGMISSTSCMPHRRRCGPPLVMMVVLVAEQRRCR
jgi:hypothetical protein